MQQSAQQNNLAKEKRALSDGQALFRGGDPAVNVFLIASGEIGLYKEDPEGARKELFSLKSGEFVGISAMLPNQKHQTTARAKGDAVVVPIDQSQIILQHQKLDKLTQNLFSYVIKRLGRLLEKQG